MNLEYFLQIIDELNNLYSSLNSDEEIICSVDVNGVIYNGTYNLNSFDGKEFLILNPNYKYNEILAIVGEKKSFINISKINTFTYRVHKDIELK